MALYNFIILVIFYYNVRDSFCSKTIQVELDKVFRIDPLLPSLYLYICV